MSTWGADKLPEYVYENILVQCCGGKELEISHIFEELEYFASALESIAYGAVAVNCEGYTVERASDALV